MGRQIHKGMGIHILGYSNIRIGKYSERAVVGYADMQVLEEEKSRGEGEEESSESSHQRGRKSAPYVPNFRTMCSGSSHKGRKDHMKISYLAKTILIIRHSIIIDNRESF